MNRVYFHTPNKTVEVRESERRCIERLINELALAVICPDDFDVRQRLTPLLRDAECLAGMEARFSWAFAFRSWFRGHECAIEIDDATIDCSELALNTVIAMGSPVMMVLGRLVATCEDFAFIDAADSEWFAQILEQGLSEKILRSGSGWESVIELAHEVAGGLAGPIVTSFSVCDQFPNLEVAQWQAPRGQMIHEAWWELSAEEQWRVAARGMRARKCNRQISPVTIDRRVASGHSAFDLQAASRGDR